MRYKTFASITVLLGVSAGAAYGETVSSLPFDAGMQFVDLPETLVNANLTGADLQFVYFGPEIDMQFVDLSHADLRFADLTTADLKYANLQIILGTGTDRIYHPALQP